MSRLRCGGKMGHMPVTSEEPSDDGRVQSGSSTLLEVTPGRPSRDLGDRIVLFDQQEGIETVLTGSGVTVWRLIAPRRRESEVTDELISMLGEGSQEFDEAISFVEQLIESRVLRRG
jgi:hypothetical protein